MHLGDAQDDEISLPFPRRRESMGFWIPACAGMTTHLVFHVNVITISNMTMIPSMAALYDMAMLDRSTGCCAALPQHVDVVLLKSVLHDWNDDDAVRILQRARDALAPDGRVLVIERVMPAQVEDLPAHRTTARSDLNMLVSLGGRERTVEDYDALLSSAGLLRQRTLPAAAAFSVIEACVRPAGKTTASAG